MRGIERSLDEDSLSLGPISKKTRSPSPNSVLATDGGGGYWLASVAMDPNAETGFISSQPSMAEFMTALPHQMSATAEGPLQHPSPNASGPLSPNVAAHHGAYHGMMEPHGVNDASGVNVTEYPWMKEKKTTRKSSQQGI